MPKVSVIPWIIKKLKGVIGIVEDGATATHAISSGKYVVWKGNLCKSNSAIAIGDTLATGSGGNLTAVDDGGLNDVRESIPAIVNNLTTNDSTKALSAAQGYALNSNVTSVDSRVNAYKGNSSTDSATLTVTAASGFTLYEVRAVRVGRIVQISGYATGTFSANTEVTFATVNVKPTYNLRTICGYGSAAYSANKCGYMIWNASDGKITVNLPTAGQAVTFNLIYIIN